VFSLGEPASDGIPAVPASSPEVPEFVVERTKFSNEELTIKKEELVVSFCYQVS
jgi:hypothetical protein